MAMHDVSKESADRGSPRPNAPDMQAVRMAHGTTSISPVTDATDITDQLVTRDSRISQGQTAYNTGVGFWLGSDTDGITKLSIGDSSSNNMTWDGTSLNISGAVIAGSGTIGGFNIGDDYIEDVADSFGLSSEVTSGDDVRFWAGETLANKDTAPFRVTESGTVTASNMNITGGSITGPSVVSLVALNLANRGWTQTSTFAASDTSTVTWTSGTFLTADGGTSLSISSGTTGTMAAKTYIYLDANISITTYQVSTTPTDAVGASKVLIAIAQNGTYGATFTVLSGQGGQVIDASSIVANSITANQLNTSLLYAGSMQIDTGGNIRSGMTDFMVGTGWFIGTPSGTAKLAIGNPSGDYFSFDGTTAKLSGSAIITGIMDNATYLTASLPVAPSTLGFSGPGGNE